MAKRFIANALVLILVLVVCATGPLQAWAASLVKAEATKAEVSTEGVVVSSDELSVVRDEAPFAIADFDRANVGSNRAIDGAYHGYAYYIGKKAQGLMYMVTDKAVVVYVDSTQAQAAEFDLASADDIALLQSLIVAIDDVASHGNAPIRDGVSWYFTEVRENLLDGVRYDFSQEIDDGYYNLIVGDDGADVTAGSSLLSTQPSFACFANLVPSHQASIVAAPSWAEQLGAFMGTLDWSPLWVTLKTTLTAILFIFVLGLACAYLCLHVSTRTRSILDTIFTIPMVLPPTVCGFLLLLACGSNTAFGRFFIDIGFPLIFSWPATVIAAVVVAFPLMYRNALGAFESLDPNMIDAARTLGWRESRIFFKLMLPLSWSSIAAGTVLAFARALGEFGATLFLAGNYLGITRTIPIAIYFEWMNGNNEVAIFWTIILVIFSFIVIMFINLWSRHTTRYRKGAVEE